MYKRQIQISTQVVIVGVGPVGLTLALDLAQRSIKVCLLEQGHKMQTGDAKCNTVSARTTETFRRPHGIPQEEL